MIQPQTQTDEVTYINVPSLCTNENLQHQNAAAILPDYSRIQENCSLPPPYEEICTNSFQDCDITIDEDPENIYNVIPADRASSTELSDDGQKFSAPDIFMEHKERIREPFQAYVNGKVVDYIPYVFTLSSPFIM